LGWGERFIRLCSGFELHVRFDGAQFIPIFESDRHFAHFTLCKCDYILGTKAGSLP